MTEETNKESHERDRAGGGPFFGIPFLRGRRRIAAAASAGLLLFFVLPGYLASQPDFFSRYPGLSEQYEPWSQSTHVETGCNECHISPRSVPQAVYRVRMVGEFYLSFVSRSREPSVFESPSSEACLSCHDDLRSVSPEGDLLIPHRAHVQVLEMECVECHNYLVHEPNAKGKYIPPMSGCLRCHDGDRAKDTCTACHTDKSVPDSHKAKDWTVLHASRADEPECVECHGWVDDWCVDCHSRRPASHGDDWRAVHRDRVEKNRNCEACHEAEFCIRCHGEVPQLNFDPALELVRQGDR